MVKMENNSGFTLIEMILTVVVLGLAVVVISTLYYQMQQVQLASSHMDLATRAAQTEIEVLRNNSYNNLTDGQTINFTGSLPKKLPDASGTVKICQSTCDIPEGLLKVTATVNYKNGDSPQKVQLYSTIGVIGIGK